MRYEIKHKFQIWDTQLNEAICECYTELDTQIVLHALNSQPEFHSPNEEGVIIMPMPSGRPNVGPFGQIID